MNSAICKTPANLRSPDLKHSCGVINSTGAGQCLFMKRRPMPSWMRMVFVLLNSDRSQKTMEEGIRTEVEELDLKSNIICNYSFAI